MRSLLREAWKPRLKPRNGSRPKRSQSCSSAPTFQAPSISALLASPGEELSCAYLAEPELTFGGKALCVDPRTGLAAYGPYSKTDSTRRQAIRVGIVGPADAIDRAVSLLERFSQRIAQSDKVDAVLHPPFPGLNSADPFQVEIVSHQVWRRPLKSVEVTMLEVDQDFRSISSLLFAQSLTEFH